MSTCGNELSIGGSLVTAGDDVITLQVQGLRVVSLVELDHDAPVGAGRLDVEVPAGTVGLLPTGRVPEWQEEVVTVARRVLQDASYPGRTRELHRTSGLVPERRAAR